MLAWFLLRRLRASALGDDVAALRDDQELALTLHVPMLRRRAEIFAATGALGAAAGAGASLLAGVAAPADLTPLLSLQLFAAVIVGGRAPLLGPALSFVVIGLIPRLTATLDSLGASDTAAGGVVTAALLVACVVVRPYVPLRLAVPRLRPAPKARFMRRARAELLRARGLDLWLGAVHVLAASSSTCAPARSTP